MASPVRQKLDFCLLYALFLMARPLPRRWLLAWGRILGTFVYRVVGFRRKVVQDNLRHAFGQELDEVGLQLLARQFYQGLGMTLMEFMVSPFRSRDDTMKIVDIDGRENLDALVALGRGGVLVSGHLGNFELPGPRLAAAGFKINAVVKPQSNASVDRLQNDMRRKAGMGVIKTGNSFPRIMEALKADELVGILADQDAGTGGLFLDFLGRPASWSRGAAVLAWKANCPLMTGTIIRRPNGDHVMRFYPMIIPDPSWDEETAIRRLTEHHVSQLEAAVRKTPDQYFWIHRRWKSQPGVDLGP